MKCVLYSTNAFNVMVYDSDIDGIVTYSVLKIIRLLKSGVVIKGAELSKEGYSASHDYTYKIPFCEYLHLDRIHPDNVSSIKASMLYGGEITVVNRELIGLRSTSGNLKIRVSSICDKICDDVLIFLHDGDIELIFDDKPIECRLQKSAIWRLNTNKIVLNLSGVSDKKMRIYYKDKFAPICNHLIIGDRLLVMGNTNSMFGNIL